LTIGKNRALPVGIVHDRITGPPPAVPARNQTEPDWPREASTAPAYAGGKRSAGKE
jgi:hypothetical protein